MTKAEFIEKYRTVRASLYKTKNEGTVQIDVDTANEIRNLSKQDLLDMGWDEIQADYYLKSFVALNNLVPEYLAWRNALDTLTAEVETICDIMV